MVVGLAAVGAATVGFSQKWAQAEASGEDRIQALEERVEDLEVEVDSIRYRCGCA
jgi:hypothetical protein